MAANDHARPESTAFRVSDLAAIIHGLIEGATRHDLEAFAANAQRLCDHIGRVRGTRSRLPTPIDDGLAVKTIVKHEPSVHPPTTQPREFDTLFFAALFLMEIAGLRLTFQWREDPEKRGRYYLRGVLSTKAGMRVYVTRIILNAEPRHRTQFNEDHHSYRLRDLIQRNGGGMLPDGKLGRQAAIDRCSESYAVNCPEHHVDLPPDAYRKLISDLLTIATAFHGEQ